MTTVLNLIDKDKRFAKHSGREYNVFSRTLRNPSNIEKWVGLTKPNWVLMDPESYWSLRGEHIEWIFDDENSLTGVKVHKKEESKTQPDIEEMEEEIASKIVESKTQPDIEEMEEEIASKIVESKTQPDIEEMEEEIASKIVESKTQPDIEERPAIEERETLQIDTEQIEEKEDEIREIANTLDELEL